MAKGEATIERAAFCIDVAPYHVGRGDFLKLGANAMKTTMTKKAKSATCERLNRINRAARRLQRRLDEYRKDKSAMEFIAYKHDYDDTQILENDIYAMQCCLDIIRRRIASTVWEDSEDDDFVPKK